MSLPQRLYDAFRTLSRTELVHDKVVSDNSLTEFQNLLNEAQPSNNEEIAQRSLVWGMYHSNPVNFMKYAGDRSSRVSAIVLWTESKRISQLFRLKGLAHVSWTADTGYTVSRFKTNSKPRRPTRGPRRLPQPADEVVLNSEAPEFQLTEYQPSDINPQQQPVDEALLGGVVPADVDVDTDVDNNEKPMGRPPALPQTEKIESWGDAV